MLETPTLPAPSVVRGALIPAPAPANNAAAADRAGQNAFGNPACFKTAFAVCRDLILLSTTIGRRDFGQSQIS